MCSLEAELGLKLYAPTAPRRYWSDLPRSRRPRLQANDENQLNMGVPGYWNAMLPVAGPAIDSLAVRVETLTAHNRCVAQHTLGRHRIFTVKAAMN